MTRALVLFCINQYTTFEMPSFTDSKDMIGAKIYKKRARWPWSRPLRSFFHGH